MNIRAIRGFLLLIILSSLLLTACDVPNVSTTPPSAERTLNLNAFLPADPTTFNNLSNANVPYADLYDLNARLKNNVVAPEVPNPQRDLQMRVTLPINVINATMGAVTQPNARIVGKSEHAYLLLTDGISDRDLDPQEFLATFEQLILPASEALFGAVDTTGVDGDERIFIVYTAGIGDAGTGYFAHQDQYPPSIARLSNARYGLFEH